MFNPTLMGLLSLGLLFPFFCFWAALTPVGGTKGRGGGGGKRGKLRYDENTFYIMINQPVGSATSRSSSPTLGLRGWTNRPTNVLLWPRVHDRVENCSLYVAMRARGPLTVTNKRLHLSECSSTIALFRISVGEQLQGGLEIEIADAYDRSNGIHTQPR